MVILLTRLAAPLLRSHNRLPSRTGGERLTWLYPFREWGRGTIFTEVTRSSLKQFVDDKNYYEDCLSPTQDLVAWFGVYVSRRPIDILVLDVRVVTRSSQWFKVPRLILDCWKIQRQAARKGIRIVVLSTDWAQPGNRLLAFALTSGKHVAVSAGFLPSTTDLRRFCRIVAPAPVVSLHQAPKSGFPPLQDERPIDVFFGGSMYEPRKTFFEALARELTLRSVKFFFEQGKNRLNLAQYSETLSMSKIVVNTSVFSENSALRQMTGKSAEAPSCGALLIAERCEALDTFLRPGKEYVPFDGLDNPAGVASLITHYLADYQARDSIARAGWERMQDYEKKGLWWPSVEQALKEE